MAPKPCLPCSDSLTQRSGFSNITGSISALCVWQGLGEQKISAKVPPSSDCRRRKANYRVLFFQNKTSTVLTLQIGEAEKARAGRFFETK
ncbi:hypothetical protein BaRGS_00003099 [Batillaria attramentaria]|uniref:Uncharacterized protein n=1 Tax=Batillaria attramentaria TaxID=370345 RepID=A0ABD0M391_9CAEN